MSTINLAANIVVAGGPALSFKREIAAEAYELLDFIVPANTTDLKVELQPGSGMSLLAITAGWYGPKLSFRATQADETTRFVLDEPLLLAGGAIAAFGSEQPKVLYFSNQTADAAAKEAKVMVLVARDATPPSPAPPTPP